jgi:hypothetical protein
MQCAHDDDQSSSDFFGLNSYSWCGGDATFETAGYNTLVNMFKDSTIPIFFSEYGCNEVKPRVFDEVAALYGDKMTAISGGLVYEYSEEPSDYGLVIINDNATVTLRTDYDNLQKQFNNLNMSIVQTSNPSTASIKPPACDANLITSGLFDKNFTVPGVCPGCADLIKDGIDNPRQGKLVEVKATKSPKAIYGSNGVEIQDLELKLLSNDESNTPSKETTGPSSTGTGTETATLPTESKKGIASKTTSGYILYAATFFTLLTTI